MNFSVFLGRSSFGRIAIWTYCFSGLILFGAATASVQARGILAGAQISGVSLGRSKYAYTLTLSNYVTSTSDISMFWFAWEAGAADFLDSEPTSIQTPAGWNSTVEGGGGEDGYSIQFVTFTTPLTPGSSVTFTFNSPDSPKIMAGPAGIYPQYATLTSQVYSGHSASGLQEVFIAKLVQPPTPTNLIVAVTGQQIVLAWPTNAGNFALQTTTNLFSSTSWTSVTNIPSVNGSLDALTLPFTNSCQFFRLKSE